MAAQQKGIFPNMTIPDIIEVLNTWGLNASPEQLNRPTPDFLESIYTACLQAVTGLSLPLLHEPTQNALDAYGTEDRELYSKALSHNLLMFHLSRFALACRIDDFCSADIYEPSKPRTIFLLSAFINFVKFTDQVNEHVNEQVDQSAAILADKEKVVAQLDEIQGKIKTMKAKIAEDEPRCQELSKKNVELRARLITLREFQEAVVQEVEQLKTEKSTLLQRKENLNIEVNSISDQISRTRSRIVQSPERIKRTISTMSVAAQEEKRTVTSHESKARDLQNKINALLVIEKDVRSCVEQLQTIEKEVRALNDAEKEVAELKDQLEMKNIEKTELNLKQERTEKQLANANQRLTRAQAHAAEKKASSQKTIERLQKEYDEMVVERRHNDLEVEELRTEADEVEKKMQEHLKESEKELNELLGVYWDLRRQTEVYMETLANKLNMKVSEA